MPTQIVRKKAKKPQRRLTITLDAVVYERLYAVVGRQRISRFIQTLVRPHVVSKDLAEGYRQMAADTEREAEALAWSEACIGDIRDETR